MPIAKPPADSELNTHPVVSRREWLAARREMLKAEKEVTRINDQLSTKWKPLRIKRVKYVPGIGNRNTFFVRSTSPSWG
jgi:hypothetical protein